MLFAHAPASFLTVYFTRKFWGKKLNAKTKSFFYFLGAFFGVILDFDLIYYFFFSAVKSHREFPSHSLFIQLVITLVIFLAGFLIKKKIAWALAFVYLISSITHLFFDTLTPGVLWLYPFSKKLYGFASINFLAESFVGQNIFFINYTLEFLILLVALLVLINLNSTLKKYFKIALVFFSIFWLMIAILIFSYSRNVYQPPVNIYYGDIDNDGLANYEDDDVDGEGIKNMSDPDSNGNGINNQEDMIIALKEMQGTRFSRSSDKLFELKKRLGFLNETDLVKLALERAGIFVKKSMVEDATKAGGENYLTSNKDSKFTFLPRNVYTFFKNNDMILKEMTPVKIGDFVFLGKNFNNIAVVAKDGIDRDKVFVFYSDEKHRTGVYDLKDVEIWAGENQGFARINANN